MRPGHELDAIIARDVLGMPHGFGFNPSTNLADAFRVVKVLLERDHLNFTLETDQGEIQSWTATFTETGRSKATTREFFDSAEMPAHAICLAALKVLK